MATFKIPAGQLGALLASQARNLPKAVRSGLAAAAEEARDELVHRVPVYRGQLRKAWQTQADPSGRTAATVTNTAPYAGIVERGARPSFVSKAGREALREWVRQRIFRPSGRMRAVSRRDAAAGGRYAQDIDRIVFAIVNTWAKRGRKGGFHVRDALPLLGRRATKEVLQELRELVEHIR